MSQATLDDIIAAEHEFLGNLSDKVDDSLEELSNLANKAYTYAHDGIEVPSLEQYYDEIIDENSTLDSKTSVGINVLLNEGDVVYKEVNCRLFINGTEEFSDYTYTGQNTEYISIWYFGNPNLVLKSYPNYLIVKLIIKDGDTPIDLETEGNNSNYSYIEETSYAKNLQEIVFYNSLPIDTYDTKKFIYRGMSSLTSIPNFDVDVPQSIELDIPQVNLDIETLAETNWIFSGLEEISTFGILDSQSGWNGTLSFPNLRIINGASSEPSSGIATVFGTDTNCSFNTLRFDEKLESIGAYSVGTVQTLILNCPNCRLNNLWYYSSTPIQNIILADNWKGRLDLTTAASDKNAEWFQNIAENKLYDFLGNGDEPFITINAHIFKIPSALVTTELTEICEAKGWTLVGG